MPHQKVVLGASSPGEGASQNRVISCLSDLSVCVAPAYVDYNLSDETVDYFWVHIIHIILWNFIVYRKVCVETRLYAKTLSKIFSVSI